MPLTTVERSSSDGLNGHLSGFAPTDHRRGTFKRTSARKQFANMATNLAPKASRWRESDFFTQVVSGLVLTLWVIVSVISRLDPYFISEVGVVFFLLFIGSVIYHDYTTKKFTLQAKLDKLDSERQAQASSMQAESMRLFTTEVQGASSRLGADMELRRAVLETVILMLEDSLRNTTLSMERRDSYNEIVNRVRDMQRSLFSATYEVQFLEARRRAMESPRPAGTNPQQPS